MYFLVCVCVRVHFCACVCVYERVCACACARVRAHARVCLLNEHVRVVKVLVCARAL